MWKNNKLMQSLPNLRETLAEGFVRILFVKTKGPMVIREAIATTNLNYVPLDRRPQRAPTASPPAPLPQGGGGCKSSGGRKHLITFFEYNYDGTPLGWRCCSKYGIIGWCDFIPLEGVENYPEPIAYEEEKEP